MKFTVTAGASANALALATLLGDDRRVQKNQALEAVHLTPDGASVKISANVLDHAVELTMSAVVEEGGALALSGARLAASSWRVRRRSRCSHGRCSRPRPSRRATIFAASSCTTSTTAWSR